MSTPASPITPAEKLAAQLEADLVLFTKIGQQVTSIAGNWLNIFVVISTLVTEIPLAIADIKATIADFKALG